MKAPFGIKAQDVSLSSNQVSFNFDLIKVASIILVALGHYNISSGLLWAPVSVALFMFGFASGYFSSGKYRGNFSTLTFWNNKIRRLFLKILIIDLFLFGIFFFANTDGLFTWMTIPSLFGMTAIFQWFGVKNTSPFGYGLWFFSVLILFYLLFPAISRLIAPIKRAIFFTATALLALAILNHTHPMPYSIWLTISGFIWGCYNGRFPVRFNPKVLTVLIILGTAAFLTFNLALNIKETNYPFLLIISVLCGIFSLSFALPKKLMKLPASLKDCVLEIYFIHYYIHLHINPFDSLHPIPKALVSLTITIICAWLLHKISSSMGRLIYSRENSSRLRSNQ